jgi:hypothetical protein
LGQNAVFQVKGFVKFPLKFAHKPTFWKTYEKNDFQELSIIYK